MSNFLTDENIRALIVEPKQLPDKYMKKLSPDIHKTGHQGKKLDILGGSGSEFRIIARQHATYLHNFSVILSYKPQSASKWVNLKRYNHHHQHTNHLEDEEIFGYHIHMATQRYQEAGLPP